MVNYPNNTILATPGLGKVITLGRPLNWSDINCHSNSLSTYLQLVSKLVHNSLSYLSNPIIYNLLAYNLLLECFLLPKIKIKSIIGLCVSGCTILIRSIIQSNNICILVYTVLYKYRCIYMICRLIL